MTWLISVTRGELEGRLRGSSWADNAWCSEVSRVKFLHALSTLKGITL